MLFANLPLSRQIKSARQHILADLRKGINLYRLTKQDAPRIRIRSLEVIPLSLSLPRLAPLSDISGYYRAVFPRRLASITSLVTFFHSAYGPTNRLLFASSASTYQALAFPSHLEPLLSRHHSPTTFSQT